MQLKHYNRGTQGCCLSRKIFPVSTVALPISTETKWTMRNVNGTAYQAVTGGWRAFGGRKQERVFVLLRAACAVCVKKITGGRFVIRILIEFGLSGDESKIRLQQKKRKLQRLREVLGVTNKKLLNGLYYVYIFPADSYLHIMRGNAEVVF